MKRVLLLVLVLLLASGAQAVIYKHITNDEVASEYFETSVRYLPEGRDTHVSVSIPELGIIQRRLYEPDDAFRRTVFLLDLPQDAEGDYLVRYVIADDDERIVKYRWVTIE